MKKLAPGYYEGEYKGIKFTITKLEGGQKNIIKEILSNQKTMRLKKGDIVKIQNPLPDENPNHRYIVVQDSIEQYNENDQIEVELISDTFSIATIIRIEMRDLVIA